MDNNEFKKYSSLLTDHDKTIVLNKYLNFNKRLFELEKRGVIRKYQQIEPTAKKFPWIKIDNQECIQFSTCNYLGLAANPQVIAAAKAALDEYGCGTCSSRYIGGTHQLHNLLEENLAKFHQKEKCVFYNTGYMANVGAISCLAEPGDLIFSDEYNHASLIDGIRLSGASKIIWQHNDVDDLEEKIKHHSCSGNKFIICESLYSMDGDFSPLKKLVALAKKHNCFLYVDEIHAIGVYGPTGNGVCAQLGIDSEIDFIMGGTSKGLGSLGGYVCVADSLDVLLKNRSRAFIFTMSLPDVLLSASIEALKICSADDQLRNKINDNANYLRQLLLAHDFNFLNSQSHIFPIMIGDSQDTLTASELLKDYGIYAQGVCYPSVPEGLGRLRISVTAAHETEHLDTLVTALTAIRDQKKVKFVL